MWLVGGGSGHGYKHGIMLGDYVASRVVGRDRPSGARGHLRVEGRHVLAVPPHGRYRRISVSRTDSKPSARMIVTPPNRIVPGDIHC